MSTLHIVNDWEKLTLRIDGVTLTATIKHVELLLKNEWKKFEIDWQREFSTVYDMGHEYQVANDVPYIQIDFYGNLLRLSLLQLRDFEMRIP